MKGVEQLAAEVKAARKPASPDNPFLQLQKHISDRIIAALDAYRDARDRIEEEMFFAFYGSPAVQGVLAVIGACPSTSAMPRLRPSPELGFQQISSNQRSETRDE
jgi:Protein of unknown function (DUF3141)